MLSISTMSSSNRRCTLFFAIFFNELIKFFAVKKVYAFHQSNLSSLHAFIILCQKRFAELRRFLISLDRKTAEFKVAAGSMQTVLHHLLGFITVGYANAQSKV